jgi:prepilin-type N-terminal cleavage/methylation domain-containing protein
MRPRSLVGAGRPHTDRSGFTLLETLVAITLSAVVLLGARAVMVQLADAADAVGRASLQADRDANAERLLRALLAQVETGADEARWFRGAERAMRFTTWCDVPAGWSERCEAAILVDTTGGTPALRAELSASGATQSVTLRTNHGPIAFRYLESASGGGRWSRVWDGGMSAPSAIGVIIGPDTLIVRVGERG